ncbi:hypothetical protein [Saccharothrix lopnurensis]|uniref:Uncharacterized protein n=1 Tax=Saccharothrix lopnurensis TaxID=1670621 RepID=A0ABW1P8X4_9PSEU
MVHFYEVRNRDGLAIADPIDWPKFLSDLATLSPDRRLRRIYNIDHWGQVYPHNERDHFILARAREEGISSFNRQNGEIIDHESDTANPYVEISVASFLPNSNIFGFVLGSQASSRVGNFEAWLNEYKALNESVSIVPVLNKNVLQRIENADEVRLLRVGFDRDQLSSISEQNSLRGVLQEIEAEHGALDVELVLRVKGRVNKDHTESRVSLLRTLRSMIGSAFTKGQADLVNFDAEGKPNTEHIDLVNSFLARKMDVSVRDEEGNPVRIQSAIAAIERAAEELRDELSEG